MNAYVSELLHLVLRWVHLIAGIMWIGNSMLFNWLDRNLEKRPDAQEGHIGQMWMLHSGGFYLVEKLMLPPGKLPTTLHWFKWQNGVTWLSGISLMILVFYMGGAALMIDPAVASLSPRTAVVASVASLATAFALYHGVWRSPLRLSPPIATGFTVAIVLFFSMLYFKMYSGRAAYVHVGVLLGTLMTGNVWFCIVPSQRELVAATAEGRAQDPAIGDQAKQRSIHNNYFTFPLLFIMLSNHFPSTFGHKHGWVILTVLALSSATIRHLMNIRFGRPTKGWLWAAIGVGAAALAIIYGMIAQATPAPRAVSRERTVPYAEVRSILQRRCLECHSFAPTSAVYRIAPNGVMFDSGTEVRRHAQNIKTRAVLLRTMPLGNTTHITDAERATLGRWIDEGAHTE